MTSNRLVVPLLGLAAAASGCHHARHTLQRQAADDFNCSPKLIRVTPYGDRSGGQFVAQGCGRRAVYEKTPDGAVLTSSIESDSAPTPARSARPPPMPAPPGPPPPPPAEEQ